jgi:hypothetical protein
MVQSGRVRKIDSVDVIQKQQTAHRRDLVAMATSASLHALLLLLLLLAVFVLPSMVGGGKRVLEVSLGDSDTFSLDATDLPVVMPPSLAEPSDVPAETPDVFVLPALEIAFIEPKKLGNESKIAPASAPTNPGAGSPSVSGTVEGAVDRITGKLVHEKLPGTVVLFLGSRYPDIPPRGIVLLTPRQSEV